MSLRFAQVVACFNQAKTLPRVLDSILSQSVLPDEVIVGDDASTDGSADVIRAYAERHPELIRPLLADENTGPAANYNRCIEAAEADLVSLVAADDELLPGKFETQFRCVREHWDRSRVFYSDSRVVYEGTGEGEDWSNPHPEGDVFRYLARRRFKMRHFWFSRALWEGIGGFDESLPLYEDWKFKMELALRTPFTYCPGIYSIYHVDGSGVSSRPHGEHLEAIRAITRELEDRPEVGPKERRALRAVRLHYEMLGREGTLAKIPYSLRCIANDPAWLAEHIAMFFRSLGRRLG